MFLSSCCISLMRNMVCKYELLTSFYSCLAGDEIVKPVEPKRIDEVKVLERGNKAFPIADDKLYRKFFHQLFILHLKPSKNTSSYKEF